MRLFEKFGKKDSYVQKTNESHVILSDMEYNTYLKFNSMKSKNYTSMHALRQQSLDVDIVRSVMRKTESASKVHNSRNLEGVCDGDMWDQAVYFTCLKSNRYKNLHKTFDRSKIIELNESWLSDALNKIYAEILRCACTTDIICAQRVSTHKIEGEIDILFGSSMLLIHIESVAPLSNTIMKGCVMSSMLEKPITNVIVWAVLEGTITTYDISKTPKGYDWELLTP
jgi:hypothetical protein